MSFIAGSLRILPILLAFALLAPQAVAQELTQESVEVPTIEPGPIHFYPAGESMLFSVYSLYEPETARARSDGFTAIGPYYGKPDLAKTIALAWAAKLPVLYTIGPRLDFETDTSAAQDDALKVLAAQVAAAAQYSEISAWALANEELRYWRSAEMRWLEAATETIRQHDPLKRPILMYEPNHRNADALARTSKYLDFITKGAYANYAGKKYSRTWVRYSVEQAVMAAKETKTTPLAVLWMARDQENDADIAAIRSWTRHDVYLSLLAGAKGVIVFSGWSKRPGFEKHYKDFYEGYASAAKELNGELGLSRVFLYGEKRTGIQVSVVDGPESQQFTTRDRSFEYPTISSDHLLLDGKHYLFIVNSANEGVSVSIDGLPSDLPVYNAFTGARDRQMPVTVLNQYDVIALTWAAPSEPE